MRRCHICSDLEDAGETQGSG